MNQTNLLAVCQFGEGAAIATIRVRNFRLRISATDIIHLRILERARERISSIFAKQKEIIFSNVITHIRTRAFF